MKRTKEVLKEFFETGDKPTQGQYADLIDSYVDAQQPAGASNRRFVIDEQGAVKVAPEQKVPAYQGGTNVTIDTSDPQRPVINATGGGSGGNFVTLDTDQTITGTKTIQSSLYTGYIQSNNGISAAKGIVAGGRIRAGANALDFTEPNNAGSATIKATITGSTQHLLQGKSGTIAHLDDIPAGGATNLSYVASAGAGTVASSSGTNTQIPLANKTHSGLMMPNFYEEGTWTPKIAKGVTLGSIGTSADANYVRMGNTVHFWINLTELTTPNAGGMINITLPEGLPVAGFTLNNGYATISGLSYGASGSISPEGATVYGIFSTSDKVFLSGVNNLQFKTPGTQLILGGTYRTNVFGASAQS